MRTRLIAISMLLCSIQSVNAQQMSEVLIDLVTSNDRIKSQESTVKATAHDLREEQAAWLPEAEVTTEAGWEKRVNPTSASTETGRNTHEITVTQLLYDFGASYADVKKARISLLEEEINLEKEKQDLILDGIKAYLDLLTTSESLGYSQRSEENIKYQTGMEQARVRRGSGLSTDVLQTKSSLAGATAKRVRAEGDFIRATNKYRATFYRVDDVTSFSRPPIPYNLLPRSLSEAINIALENNLDLKIKALDVQTAEEDVRAAKAKFGPKVEFKMKANHKHDDAGTFGDRNEFQANVKLTYPILAGGGDVAGLKSARDSLYASRSDLEEERRMVEEAVRNAWQSLITARNNAQHLRNQANISGEFLDLARRERRLGTRSLLDVLNGETDYINALSTAAEAETDMITEAYTLLSEMGALDLRIFERQNQQLEQLRQQAIQQRGGAAQPRLQAPPAEGQLAPEQPNNPTGPMAPGARPAPTSPQQLQRPPQQPRPGQPAANVPQQQSQQAQPRRPQQAAPAANNQTGQQQPAAPGKVAEPPKAEPNIKQATEASKPAKPVDSQSAKPDTNVATEKAPEKVVEPQKVESNTKQVTETSKPAEKAPAKPVEAQKAQPEAKKAIEQPKEVEKSQPAQKIQEKPVVEEQKPAAKKESSEPKKTKAAKSEDKQPKAVKSQKQKKNSNTVTKQVKPDQPVVKWKQDKRVQVSKTQSLEDYQAEVRKRELRWQRAKDRADARIKAAKQKLDSAKTVEDTTAKTKAAEKIKETTTTTKQVSSKSKKSS